jgi:catechol 2,3-dioxygenase-like lactoylglutathione lyase family enzyme
MSWATPGGSCCWGLWPVALLRGRDHPHPQLQPRADRGAVFTELIRGILAPFGHGLWTGILGGVLFGGARAGRLRPRPGRAPGAPGVRLAPMDWKLELVPVPVSDVDRAKAFYVDQVGFNADHDAVVNDALRFVQLTPPGSACSIVIGTGHHGDGARLAAGSADGCRERQRRPRGTHRARSQDQRCRRAALGVFHLLQRSRRQYLVATATTSARLDRRADGSGSRGVAAD